MSEAAPERMTPENRTASGRWAKGNSGGPATRFQPGVSGNPGGRPADSEKIRALARAAGPEAFHKLIALMRGDKDVVACRASTEILDRVYGKPIQTTEVLGAFMHVDVAALSDAELRLHVTRLREHLAPNRSPPPANGS